MASKLPAFLKLTKPTISLLVIITGATALVMEGSLVDQPVRFILVLLGLFMASGSANAMNQYFERDIDKRMTRTARKRPLANGTLKPGEALVFAVSIGILGVGLFAYAFNLLSAALAGATILFYAFFYTLYLKPRTSWNIVIGGAAGAMGPVIAWAAATGSLALTPWLLFAVIFFWTPPHFWALAYCLKEDYKAVSYPMMPLVAGDDETLRQMLWYTVVTVGITLGLMFVGVGLLYVLLATGLGALFLYYTWHLMRTRQTRDAWGLFGYSIVYLLVLFVALMIDARFLYQPWLT